MKLTLLPFWPEATSNRQPAQPATGWFPRAGGSSGGGGGGARGSSGSSSSSGGSRSGSSGSSRSGGTTLRGGSGSSAGKTIVHSSQLKPAQRAGIWSSGAPRYSSTRPPSTNPALAFGFWPLAWSTNVADGGAANNDTRPGGPLMVAPLHAPGETNVTYLLYGDTQSVTDLVPTLMQDCAASNSSTTYDASANTTLQRYREESFALLGVGVGQAGVNTSFAACLNDTIGDNLLVSGAHTTASPAAAACLVAALVSLARSYLA